MAGRRARLSPSEWVVLARQGILDLLEVEHAAVWDEIEAKIADVRWPTLETHIDPHHLSTARRQLIEEELVADVEEPTRGGRPIGVFHRTDLPKRKTSISRAAQRKRLLQARYQRWGFGDKSTAALLGSSGERVVRASLEVAAAKAGMMPIQGDFRPVSKVLGMPISGPFDNGVYMPSLGADDMPGSTVTVPIEVKNRRTWIYPNSDQLYQLLAKSAALQAAKPDYPIVPVLVCRRRHITTQKMARQLGFFVVEAKHQFIDWPETEDVRLLEEVRDELGYLDLVNQAGPSDNVQGYLAKGLPKILLEQAERWAHFGPKLKPYFDHLRREIAGNSHREVHERVRQAAVDLGATERGW